jgi:hypothetical protein
VFVRVRVESLLYRNLEVAPEDNLACLLNLGASEKFLVVPGHPHKDARTHDESAHGFSACVQAKRHHWERAQRRACELLARRHMSVLTALRCDAYAASW